MTKYNNDPRIGMNKTIKTQINFSLPGKGLLTILMSAKIGNINKIIAAKIIKSIIINELKVYLLPPLNGQ
jgi:hypothetical protein